MAKEPTNANTLGFPKGFKGYSPFPFAGMNLQASPLAMDDKEFYYLENFLRLGDGYLRTAWDVGAPLYAVPTGKAMVSFFFFTIGSTYYVAVFLNDGSAIQVAQATGHQTVMGPPGTFYNAATGAIPACSQWGAQFLLISNNNNVNDFWAWDGALLWGAGSAAPNQQSNPDILADGGGYSSPPTATAVGGYGSGIQLSANVSGGSLVQLQITNPGSGYQPGDVVQVIFSGGGPNSNDSAYLTAQLNPSPVAGVTVTAPGNGYTYANVFIAGQTGGGGATATATVHLMMVTAIAVNTGGSGYTSPPAVTISGGGGSGATATAVITNGVVTLINVINPGMGYMTAPDVTLAGGGSGATATATIRNGQIYEVNIVNPGANYTSAPAVTITGDGTGAQAVASLVPSGVASITVVNGGTGFTSVPLLQILGGGGAGAVGIAHLTPTSVQAINLTAGGSGYTSAPTVSFIGGGPNPGPGPWPGPGPSPSPGSGAAATAVLAGDAVGYVTITNGGSGYVDPLQVVFTGGGGAGAGGTVVFAPTSIGSASVSNTGQYYTNAPSVLVESGANNSAYATILLMPFGVSGSCLETFNSRAWIGNPAPSPFSILPPGGNFQFSAAGGFTDFATPDGGGLFVNSDRFLLTQYVGIRQSNGYLYFFGDGSVSVVSNVQTTGTPAVTTFTYQNVDPQIGLSWRDSLNDYGRANVFGNTTGIYGLYGGNVTKISGKLDRLFVNASFPRLTERSRRLRLSRRCLMSNTISA